jgi:hypothetical protein
MTNYELTVEVICFEESTNKREKKLHEFRFAVCTV